MFIAVDENGNRIFAEKDSPKQKNYFCPICKDKVRLRCGDNNAPHFAHVNACSDDFTHDMSEWHKSWQMLFPINNREVVIKHGNETHRADVLCYGTVIEFQHSPISKSEFSRRNKFYTDAGKKVVWIFDLTELFSGYDESGRLYISGDCLNYWGKGNNFVWKHPWRFLEDCLPQNENDVEIFFHTAPFSDNPKSQDSDGYIDKVVWVDPRYKTSWGRFQTNDKIATGYDLWKYLKERWEQNSTKSNCDVSNQRNYKYLVDGEIIEADEFEKFLNQNKPYHVLEDGQRNYKYGIAQNGEPHFWCGDPHQKPDIQRGHCQWGCYSCLAIEEINPKKFLIYCKSPRPKGITYDPKVFKRVYK